MPILRTSESKTSACTKASEAERGFFRSARRADPPFDFVERSRRERAEFLWPSTLKRVKGTGDEQVHHEKGGETDCH